MSLIVPSQKVQSRRPPYKCHDLLDHVFHHSLDALLQREPEERFQDKGGQSVSSKSLCSDHMWILITHTHWILCSLFKKKTWFVWLKKLFLLSLKGRVCMCRLAWLPFLMSYFTALGPGLAHALQMCVLSPTCREGDTLLPWKNLSWWLKTSFSLWRKWRAKTTNNNSVLKK